MRLTKCPPLNRAWVTVFTYKHADNFLLRRYSLVTKIIIMQETYIESKYSPDFNYDALRSTGAYVRLSYHADIFT